MRSGVRTSVLGVVGVVVAIVEVCWISVSQGVQGRAGDLGDDAQMVSASGERASGLPYVHAVQMLGVGERSGSEQ